MVEGISSTSNLLGDGYDLTLLCCSVGCKSCSCHLLSVSKTLFKHMGYEFLSEKELEGPNDLQQEEAAIMNTQHRYAGWKLRPCI